MKPITTLIIAILAVVAVSNAHAQSRRVPPASGGKANTRAAATPTPTPTPSLAEQDETVSAEEDSEVVSVDTRLVTIPIRVIDRKGRFVGGLSKENFTVLENDTPQEIAHFSNEAQPFTVALVLDMSYSAKFKLADIQSAAIAFIDQLRPNDKIMVISFDEEVHMLCEPTSDRNTIYRAIRSTQIGTGTSLYEAVDMTMNERIRSIEGRKAIVLFTDGVDTTSRTSHDLENLSDAMELDALIYPIRYDTFADVQAMKNRPQIRMPDSKPVITPPINPQGGQQIPTSMPVPVVGTPGDRGTTPEEYARGEEYLDQLALRTGGRIYVADTIGNMNQAYSKIASELREFYSIGYYPTADLKPGENVKLKVRVDQKGVAVKARTGYAVGRKRDGK
ncbi:MAG: VWA domain-containing protein [Pyrinomonadaceae bacterium]|nr:VWA domain-containing protein [Pyrinomonadaceae bacterium]